MNKKLMQKWVKALRSGKYEQARGELYNKTCDSYCCLGVLYKEVRGKNPRKGAILLNGDYCGLASEDGARSEAMCLSILNDVGLGFNAIADIIEKEYKDL